MGPKRRGAAGEEGAPRLTGNEKPAKQPIPGIVPPTLRRGELNYPISRD